MSHDREQLRLSAQVRTANIRDYRRVLGERISSLPHVASTSTYVAMETVRESA